jgi:RNA polymerase sigma-B factor
LAAGEDPGYRRVEDHSALGSALRVLPQRERRIVAMRYGEELSQQQIAERIGISQMHVSRLLRRALERLSLVLVH